MLKDLFLSEYFGRDKITLRGKYCDQCGAPATCFRFKKEPYQKRQSLICSFSCTRCYNLKHEHKKHNPERGVT